VEPIRLLLLGEAMAVRACERVSLEILNKSRVIGFTEGPDGAAAALAFAIWGDDMLPD